MKKTQETESLIDKLFELNEEDPELLREIWNKKSGNKSDIIRELYNKLVYMHKKSRRIQKCKVKNKR